MIYRRKSTAYYVVMLLAFGLAFGFGTLALTGGGLLSADPSLEEAVHGSEWIVNHDAQGEHHQTLLGDLLFGKQASAHAGWYCGHDQRWVTIDGVLHKQVFLYHSGNDVHHYKAAHFIYSGTGYVRTSDWFYNSVAC